MGRVHPALLAVALPLGLGCGEILPPKAVTPAPDYALFAVLRVRPDGFAAERFDTLELRLEAVSTSGGSATARLVTAGGAQSLSGTWDEEADRLLFDPVELTLSGTVSERLSELGGVIDEALPVDGLGDEWSGFLRATAGARVREGTLIGLSDQDARPPAPPAGAFVVVAGAGTAERRLEAPAGTVPEGATVEVLRFELSESTPERTAGTAAAGGALALPLRALPGDALLVRWRRLGRAGPPVLVPVP